MPAFIAQWQQVHTLHTLQQIVACQQIVNLLIGKCHNRFICAQVHVECEMPLSGRRQKRRITVAYVYVCIWYAELNKTRASICVLMVYGQYTGEAQWGLFEKM